MFAQKSTRLAVGLSNIRIEFLRAELGENLAGFEPASIKPGLHNDLERAGDISHARITVAAGRITYASPEASYLFRQGRQERRRIDGARLARSDPRKRSRQRLNQARNMLAQLTD